jgi:hypothetical protein
VAVDPDVAAVRLEQADQVLQEHRLTRSGGSEQYRDLTGRQRQGDVLPDRLLAEPLGQVLDPDLDAHAVLLTGYPLAAPARRGPAVLNEKPTDE